MLNLLCVNSPFEGFFKKLNHVHRRIIHLPNYLRNWSLLKERFNKVRHIGVIGYSLLPLGNVGTCQVTVHTTHHIKV